MKSGIQRKVQTRLYLFAAMIVLFAGIFTGAWYYKDSIDDYNSLVYGYLRSASNYIDGDRIKGYVETLEPDEYYDEVLRYLTVTRNETAMQLFYVFVPYKNDLVYVWQTDDNPYSWLGKREAYMDGGKEAREKSFRKDPIQEISFYRDPTYGHIACGFYPIFDSSGEPVALVGLDLSANDIERSFLAFIGTLCLTILVATVLAGIVFYFSLRKKIVTPIHRLNDAAGKMADSLEKDDLPAIDIHTGDELEALADSFTKMYGDIRHYIQENAAISAEKGRIASELNVATQIQADMLPRIFPPFPERKEFDIYATMTPAKEVGGDFYDFFMVDDDHLALVIADVSGKGVPAALFMVIAKTLIKNRAQLGGSPSEVLSYANDQLCAGNEAQLFVTVWMAIIEISTGKGIAANAGHENPVLKRVGEEYEPVVYPHSVAVAIMEGLPFEQHEFELHPGDILFVHTDGVTEATDAENELYGPERLVEALNSRIEEDPQKILSNVKADIDAFVKEAPQFDDITMLALCWHGKK